MDESKLLRTLGVGKGSILVPHIDMFLEAGDFPETWKVTVHNYKADDGWYHPSGHCFTPPRLLYFDRALARPARGADLTDMVPVKRPIPASLRKTFDCGHMWHGYIGEVLVEMGFVEEGNVERKVRKDLGGFFGSGTADLVGVEIPDQGTWLVDMKTMNSAEFNRGANPTTFKKWEAQVNCYMDWLGTDKGLILAIQKDSPHNFREYIIERKAALTSEIYERWAYVEECIANGEPPKCEHAYGASCELKDLCSYA